MMVKAQLNTIHAKEGKSDADSFRNSSDDFFYKEPKYLLSANQQITNSSDD